MEFNHVSVMLDECIEALNIKSDGVYMDGTLGGGGHSSEIASRLNKNGTLIMFDLDNDALSSASERLHNFECKKIFAHDNFKNFLSTMEENDITSLDGILLDLGVSSYQIDNAERGFSYITDGPLNMAMDEHAKLNAEIVVNEYSEDALERIFREYGEERFAGRIANAIVSARKSKKLHSTLELAEIIASAVPAKARYSGGHPAKRVFQAIRIEVNGELDGLRESILSMVRNGLHSGGRMAVITFHSLEDRIVKDAFNLLASDCICDKKLPVCVCHHKAEVRLLNKKPLLPTATEIKSNPRSHSAKLRVLEKL